MPNFLVPDIDTSGIRSADIQARNTNYMNQLTRSMNLGNVLKEREIERLPITEAREEELYNLKTEVDKTALEQAKTAVFLDFLPMVNKDTYGDFVDWLRENKSPMAAFMIPEKDIQDMSDDDFKFYVGQGSKAALEKLKAKLTQDEIEARKKSALEIIDANRKAELEKIKERGDKDKEGEEWKFVRQDSAELFDRVASIFDHRIDATTGKRIPANENIAQKVASIVKKAEDIFEKGGGKVRWQAAANMAAEEAGVVLPSIEELYGVSEKMKKEIQAAFPDADDVFFENGAWFVKQDGKTYPVIME